MSLYTEGQSVLVISQHVLEFVKIKAVRIKESKVTYWVESSKYGEYSIVGVPDLGMPWRINLMDTEAQLIATSTILGGIIAFVILVSLIASVAT